MRKDISPVIKLVAEDVKEMLEQVSRLKVKKGWEFLLEADQDFISRHPDIVQRQNMIWEAKFKQLSLVLKLPPGDIKMAAVQAASSVTPPKRKRTVSRSRTKSGGAGSMSESMSDTENDAGKGERSRRASGSSKGRKNSGNYQVLSAVISYYHHKGFAPRLLIAPLKFLLHYKYVKRGLVFVRYVIDEVKVVHLTKICLNY